MIDLTSWATIIAIALRSGASLLYATLGEILAERSGVLNLGLEGMLLSSAMFAFAASYHTDNVWLGLLASALMGGFLAMLFACLTVLLQADQIVSGLALFIFGSGLASFLGQRLGPNGGTLVGLIGPRLPRYPIPILSDIPWVGNVFFNQDILIYGLYILTPVIAYVIFRTRMGLNLRAVGENPTTADAMGIRVLTTRFVSVMIGGAIVGLGGAHISLSYAPGWTENITGGRGWIAIAMVIFSTWHPLRAVLGALLFGTVSALQFRLQAIGSPIPAAFLRMLPYVFTLLVLILISHPKIGQLRLRAPAALGRNYFRESAD